MSWHHEAIEETRRLLSSAEALYVCLDPLVVTNKVLISTLTLDAFGRDVSYQQASIRWDG